MRRRRPRRVGRGEGMSVYPADDNADRAFDAREWWESEPCCGGHVWLSVGGGQGREVGAAFAFYAGPTLLAKRLSAEVLAGEG